ncbi:type II secretion system inner membrane protein GspF [Idiomarina loihiensis]|uniref:General secretion pathway protein F n=1 Tax=Idiomarina loihiensis (strain ATCC BAA-735 / DSM 15497 / L2-TR) TaxID=283942 RepID=Q5QYA6_IDILO|nr:MULTISPECIES: type II secretion system inner membrane protein GspF [Idiomarina]AAV82856.1 Type II secretory pathway, component PulF [Idiomarina loihiensis L2TR]AGM36899.1 Type II secretory pathway, component PulF [Idiomarina loihiensis GSL 199]MBL4856697.1 type II secretion system inner membrane protein GspF [Idiomarina sp.]MRJ44784.1 type II secretion system protein GspF [Idiomarina loihiensis]PHQ89639.1 MAG: type II secretion system protein GspF [Idiomarina sp.]
MAAFEYQAVEANGRKKKGVLEADTERQVRQLLREKGLMPLTIEPAADQDRKKTLQPRFGLPQRKVKAQDLALITRQLSTLVGSALPIEQALLAVADQTEKPRLKKLLMSVRSKVVEGYGLAEAMSEFPGVFDSLYTAMVAAGEKSGHLDTVLDELANYTEQRQHMKSQLTQALIYPLMLTLVAIGIVVFLLVSIVPQIVDNFSTMGQDLPPTTLAMIAISEFLQNWGLWLLIGIALVLVAFNQWLRNEKNRLKYHRRLLKLPMLGKVIRGVSTARFARTLSILTSSAVPLLDGLRITSSVIGNLAIRQAVDEAAGRVREGASMRGALQETGLFPPMMLHMIAAGEKSGELEQMLKRSADNQDKEFENLVSVSLKVFEPVLIVTMAGIVFFIVLSIIQPILQLNNSVGL